MKWSITILLTALLVSTAMPAKKTSGPSTAADSMKQEIEKPVKLYRQEPADTLVITHHAQSIGGGQLRYSALAGRMKITDSSGSPIALIFYTAYVRQPEVEINRRPITFAFNGGPGASSVWLHLAAAGPRRTILGENGTLLPGTDTLVDNQYSWLPFTDLVFVDPVGTGYSRAAPSANQESFFSVKGDIEAMAEFIRLFLTRNRRWTSPLFLAGESYGTLRAAGLSHYLQNAVSKDVAGVILISSVVGFQVIAFDPGNDLAYVLALPSYTAAAWYHGQLSGIGKTDLAATLASAERWATTEYLSGLMKGSALPAKQRDVLVDSLAAYTGLSRQYIIEHGMRIAPYAFVRKLLAQNRRTVGLLDSRVTGITAPPMDPYAYRDPSMFVVEAPLTALINDYIRRELLFSTSLEYIVLSERVNRAWQWSNPLSQGYADESDALCSAMSVNKNLRVFAAMGYFDLTTPFLSQRYTLEHLAFDSTFIGRIRMKSYQAGHQLYTYLPSLKQLTEDVGQFVLGK